MTQVNKQIGLQPETWKALTNEAKKERRSRNSLIKIILEDYLLKKNKK